MAKKQEETKSIDRNFENLKAQMMKKKDLAIKNDETKINEMERFEESSIDESESSTPKIVIKKQEKQDVPKRITYYLNNSTIKKIDKYSKLAGMGKSSFVQTLLDLALDNLEIK